MSSESAGESGLEVEGLEVRYGETVAVQATDLAVERYEIVSLLGPSGCGKSTLLRAIAGLERPTSGGVSWRGRSLAGVAPHQRGIGLMFQDHALFPHRDVAANIGFGPKMRGATPAARRRVVAELLDTVRLPGYGHRRVDQLSGGEAQRVALARSLAAEPELLLLDEPLGSLDRLLREELVLELGGLMVERRLTGLHVTHDHAEAFAMGDRIAVMIDGRIERVARPEALRTDPGSVAVAMFLGIGAVYRVVEATENDLVLSFATIPRPAHVPADATMVAILPESVRLGDGEPEAGDIEGRVESCVFQGDRFVTRFAVGEAEPFLESFSAFRMTPGEPVRLRLDPTGVRPIAGG